VGGVRVVARGGAKGATVEIGFRTREGGGLGLNLSVGPGWSETVVPFSNLLTLWGLKSRDDFSWREVDQVSFLTGAWLQKKTVVRVRARATEPHTTGFELALIETDGVPWGTVVPLTAEWRTLRIPVRDLRLFTQWGKEFADAAAPHLRVGRVAHVNVCFGRWLFKETAAEQHAVEIAEIALEQQK